MKSAKTSGYYEAQFNNTLRESCQFVSAITRDLEESDPTKWGGSSIKIELIEGLFDKLFTADELIKYYIVYVFPHRKWLRKRKDQFFLENTHIYPGATEEDIKFFIDMWKTKGIMKADEKNTMWEFFDAMIDICEQWKKLNKYNPLTDKHMLKEMPEYSHEYFTKRASKTSSSTKLDTKA